jgi:hypothetical protein
MSHHISRVVSLLILLAVFTMAAEEPAKKITPKDSPGGRPFSVAHYTFQDRAALTRRQGNYRITSKMRFARA